jgi:hypothetical protein
LGRESNFARRSQAATDAEWPSANPDVGSKTAHTKPAAMAIRMNTLVLPLDIPLLRSGAPIMTADAPLFNDRVTGATP